MNTENYTAEQVDAAKAEAIRIARGKYAGYRRSRATALERAKIAAEAETADRRREAAKACVKLAEMGVSLRQIGRDVMKTSDYATIRRLIGEVEMEKIRDSALASRFDATEARKVERKGGPVRISAEGEKYILTLDGAELEAARTRAQWDAPEVPAKYRSAEIKAVAEHFTAVTEAWVVELGEQHPVVAWIAAPSSQAKIAAAWEMYHDSIEGE